MTLKRNIFSNASATATGAVIQLILVLSMARWLSESDFAVYITAAAVAGFGEMASDFGVRIWGARQFAIATKLDGLLGSMLLPKFAFSLLLVMVVLSLPIDLLNVRQAMLVALIACSQPSTDPLLWFMRGRERLDIEALVFLIWRALNALGMGIVAWSLREATPVLLAWLGSNFLRLMVEWRLPVLKPLRSAPAFQGVDGGVGRRFLEIVSQSFPIGLAFIAMAVYQRLGVLLLSALASSRTVAHFGAAFTLIASAGFVATSITVASFPILANAVKTEDWLQFRNIANQKLKLIAGIFLPGCFAGMFLSPWVSALIYPPEYMDSAVAMTALLPGLYVSSINFALKYLMNILDKNWLDVVSVFVGILIFAGILVFVAIVLKVDDLEMLKVTGTAWGLGESGIFIVKWMALKCDDRMGGLGFMYHLAFFLLLQAGMLVIVEGGIYG